MSKNMGNIDRILRGIVGIILISLVFVGPQTPWGWVGLLPLITSFFGFCPAYFPFKFSTIRKKES